MNNGIYVFIIPVGFFNFVFHVRDSMNVFKSCSSTWSVLIYNRIMVMENSIILIQDDRT